MSVEISVSALPNFDNAKDMTARDDGAADVHEVENAAQLGCSGSRFSLGIPGENARFDASSVEDVLQKDKKKECNDL